MLGQFGVSGDMAVQQIDSLSGGQKSRVAFAVLCGHSPNFLILGTSNYDPYSYMFHIATTFKAAIY